MLRRKAVQSSLKVSDTDKTALLQKEGVQSALKSVSIKRGWRVGWLGALGACVVWLVMAAHCCWGGWKLLVHVWSGWLWQHIVVGVVGSTWCMCGLAGYGSTLLLGWLEVPGACVVWLAMAAHCCWGGWEYLVHVWSGWLWQHIVVLFVGIVRWHTQAGPSPIEVNSLEKDVMVCILFGATPGEWF